MSPRAAEGAGIVDHEIGRPPFFCQRKLAVFTTFQIGRCPAPARDPGLTLFNRCVYKNDGVTDAIPTGFQEHGRVQQHDVNGGIAPGRRDLLLQVPPDDRMNDLFEVVPGLAMLFILTKHHFGQSVPANVLL